ncbi:MAG: F0F1 ATP synthase subunit alpha, partial [Bacilli bacterium]
GQIFLEADMFYSGQRPAVNVGISVSRVGGNAQIKAMKKVAGTLRLDLAAYRDLAAFAQFGSDLDKATQARLTRGARTVEILKQGVNEPMTVEKQVVSIYTAIKGHLDDIELQDVGRFEKEFIAFVETSYAQVFQSIVDTKDLTADNEKLLIEAIEKFKKGFAASA